MIRKVWRGALTAIYLPVMLGYVIVQGIKGKNPFLALALIFMLGLTLSACGSCLDPFNHLSDCPKW